MSEETGSRLVPRRVRRVGAQHVTAAAHVSHGAHVGAAFTAAGRRAVVEDDLEVREALDVACLEDAAPDGRVLPVVVVRVEECMHPDAAVEIGGVFAALKQAGDRLGEIFDEDGAVVFDA